ncbi:MAG: DUF2628 domain-containing protein [Methylovirgula sp.]|jgi:Protein of unknown function (DUF2628)
MPVYTVHLPTRDRRATLGVADEFRPATDAALVGAEFVPERFSRAAFFLGPIWLAWHRLWLELLLWLVVFSLLAIQPILGAGTSFLIGVLLEIFLGLEANDLRRGRLARSGYRLIDVAAGATRDDAERSFYRRYCADGALPPPTTQGSAPPSPIPPAEVLGVFPLPEHPR